MSELSYQGVLVFERGDHTESLRLTRQIANGREYERLEYLDGAQREIIRSGTQLTCIQPGQRLIRLFQKNQLLREGLSGLQRFYLLKGAGDGRVAGRQTFNVDIVPRDEYRLGYRFALDQQTGLLLRSELLDADGRVLERFQFATIELGSGPGAAWMKAASADAEPRPTVSRKAQDVVPPWSPQWLPPGFELAMPASPEAGEIQTYSDGLAMVSVFVAPVDPETGPSGDGQARQGATVAYTRPVHFAEKDYLITVVGEVPVATARRIGAAVAWQEKPASR